MNNQQFLMTGIEKVLFAIGNSVGSRDWDW